MPRIAVMHASPDTGLDHPSFLGGSLLERLLLTVTANAVGFLSITFGGVLLMSRLFGSASASPNSILLIIVAAMGTLIVAVGDLAKYYAAGRYNFPARFGFLVAIASVALPLPTTHRGTTVVALLSLAVSVFLIAQPFLMPWLIIPPSIRSATKKLSSEPIVPPRLPEAQNLSEPTIFALTHDEHVLQQQQRYSASDGLERIRGQLFLSVPSGVRSASGHIGFCPPFLSTPTVEVETDYDEVEAVVSAAEVLPWGVRIECRLDEPTDEPFEIPIQLLVKENHNPS
ncbi:MAG: hypothetical protein ABGW78_02160 [Pirellulales bacterium]